MIEGSRWLISKIVIISATLNQSLHDCSQATILCGSQYLATRKTSNLIHGYIDQILFIAFTSHKTAMILVLAESVAKDLCSASARAAVASEPLSSRSLILAESVANDLCLASEGAVFASERVVPRSVGEIASSGRVFYLRRTPSP